MSGYCRKCGTKLSSNARYCKTCGLEVTSPSPAAPVEDRPVAEVHSQKSKPTTSSRTNPPASHPPAQKRSGFPVIPVLIGGGLLGLACVAVIVVIFVFRAVQPETVITNQPDVLQTEMTVEEQVVKEEVGYQAKQTAPGETTSEVVDAVISGSSPAVSLSDGTRLEAPGRLPPLNITLARESNTISLPDRPDLQTSGSMRVVTFDHANVDETYVLQLTIPAAELGDLDLETVNAVRVGKYVINGQAQPDDVAVLSVTPDDAGNLVISDGLIPRIEDVSALANEPTAPHLANLAAQSGRSFVQYVLMTFQDHLEWSYAPRLIRMVPDSAANEFRHPADLKKDKDYLQKPVCNVIVLVHGHNEEENDGSRLAASDIQPWGVSYKRDAWTAYYRNFLEKRSVQAGCTAFYEFIYPTYFPAYTPLESGVVAPLGTTLAKALTVGARNDGYLLKRMMAEKIDFNLYFVAHSMGGLVARGAIRELNQTLTDSFQQLVTWGTPHHGSPLVTMGYLFRKGYRINMGHINRAHFFVVPIEGEVQILMGSALTRWILDVKAQIDTPGTRDLRWDNYRPLRLDDIFSDDTRVLIINEPDLNVYNLQDGTWLFNRNLLMFNDNDPYKLQDKYSFVYGVTLKKLPDLKPEATIGATLKKLPDQIAETAIGATLIPMLVKDGTAPVPEVNGQHLMGASDGAVPLISMIGAGLSNFRFEYLGNVDHEEYFLGSMDTTSSVFVRTSYRLDLDNKRTTCPELALIRPTDVRGIAVDANLDISAEFKLDPALDDEPGKRIKSAEALFYINGTKDEHYLGDLTVSDDGKLEGAYPMPDLGTGNHQLVVRAHLLDDSIIESVPASRALYTYFQITIENPDWNCTISGVNEDTHMVMYNAEGIIDEYTGDGYFTAKVHSLPKYNFYVPFDFESDTVSGRVAASGQSVSVEFEQVKEFLSCSSMSQRLKGSVINIPFAGHYEDSEVYDVFSVQGTTEQILPYLRYWSQEAYDKPDGSCVTYDFTQDQLTCATPWTIKVTLYSKYLESRLE